MIGIEWVSSLDHDGFTQSLNEMVSQISQTKSAIESMGTDSEKVFERLENVGDRLSETFKRIGALAGVSLTVGGATSFIQKVKETRSYFQDIESSMKVFLGDEQKASDFTNKLKDYAYYNMFEFSELANASKQMIAYGQNVDDIIPRLDQLSNVATGTSAPLMELVGAYNRIKNIGYIDSRGMQSWAAKGLVVNDILKEMGEEIQGNKVSFEQFNRVLDHVTGEGGMFHELMASQMQNISAEEGQLEDNLASLYNTIGEKYQDRITGFFKGESSLAGWVEENIDELSKPVDAAFWIFDKAADGMEALYPIISLVANNLGTLVVTYGAYRASLVAVNAVEKAQQNFLAKSMNDALDDEIKKYDELSKKMELAKKNADLRLAVKDGALSEKQAGEIADKRERLEALQVENQLVDVNDKINELKKLKLDEDLQEMVSVKNLNIAQAEEIQKRRENLKALEREIAKKKEAKIADIEARAGEKETAINNNKRQLNRDKRNLEDSNKRLDSLDERIGKYQSVGDDEKVKELKEEELSIYAKQDEWQASIAETTERIKILEEERRAILKEQEDILMRYGTDNEKLDLLTAQKIELQEQLQVAEEESRKTLKSYEEKKAANERYRESVQSLNEELSAAVEEGDIDSIGAIQEKIDATESLIDVKGEETLATEAGAAAKKVETIQNDLNTISEKQNSIATGANTAAENANTVSENANTAAVQRNTIGQRINTLATKAGTFAHNVFSAAITSVKNAFTAMKAAMLTNPFTAIITGITMLISLFDIFGDEEEDVVEMSERFGEEANKATRNVEGLFAILQNTSRESKAHKDATEELVKIYKEYGIEIDKESANLETLTAKHEQLKEAIKAESIERQKANAIQTEVERYQKAVEDAWNEVKDSLDVDDKDKDALLSSIKEVVTDEELLQLQRLREEENKLSKGRIAGTVSIYEHEHALREMNDAIGNVRDKVVSLAESQGMSRQEANELAITMTGDLARSISEANGSMESHIDMINSAALMSEYFSGKMSQQAIAAALLKMPIDQLTSQVSALINIWNRQYNLDLKIRVDKSEVPAELRGASEEALHNIVANRMAEVGQAKMMYGENWASQKSKYGGTVGAGLQRAEDAQFMLRLREEERKKKGGGTTTPSAAPAPKSRGGGSKGGHDDTAKRQAQEIADRLKHEEELRRVEQQGAYAEEEARIAAIDNSAERERAQSAYQHKKTLDEVKEQEREVFKTIYEERKKAYERQNKGKYYENTDAGKAGWASLTMASLNEQELKEYASRMKKPLAEQNKENAEWQRQQEELRKQELASMRDYLKEYGSIEQQRLAITQEYEEKIKEARTPYEAAALEIKRDEELDKLQQTNIEQVIDWGGVFNDLEGHTEEYLVGLKEQLYSLLATGNLPIDQMATVQEKIRSINDVLSKQQQLWNFVGTKQQEHNRRVQEATDAQNALAKATADEASANVNVMQSRMESADFLRQQGLAPDTEINQDLITSLGAETEAGKRAAAIMQRMAVTEGKLNEARRKTAEATVKAKNAEDAANESTLDRIARYAENVGEFTDKYLSDIPDLLNTVGLGGAGEKAQKGLDAINNGVGAVADFYSGNYVGAAMKGINAINSFGEAVGIWSNSNRAEVEEANNKLAIATSVNTEAINRLTEEMHSSSPLEAFKKWEQAQAAMQANEQAARQTMINNAGMYDGGHSLRHDLDDTYVNRIAEYLGLKKGGKSWNIEDLLKNADAATLNKLYETEEGKELLTGLGQSIADAEDEGNYNGMFQDILQYMNDFNEEAYENLRLSLQEAVTGVSFDSFRDGFKSALMDMDKSAKDFSNDFTQQLMQSVLNAQIEELYKDRMESLYKGWSEALSGDNMLDAGEVARLQQEQDALVRDMIGTRDMLASATGYDDMIRQQSASQKGWQSMGQETADELNGRFTALQIAGESINAYTSLIYGTLNTMAMVTQTNGTAVADIRDMMINTNSYLEDVVRYARLTYQDFGTKIDKLNNYQEDIYNAIRRA